MKIIVLHSHNIFCSNSASSNRWRTIIEGLTHNDFTFDFFIVSGYQSEEERISYRESGFINDRISYKYISSQKRYGFWTTRINIYILSKFRNYVSAKLFREAVKAIKPRIVFLSPSLDPLNVYYNAFPSRPVNFKLMTEFNEYNDIWDIHLTNYLQKLRNKKFHLLLTHKIFNKLDICLVMTDVLITHYNDIQENRQDISFLKVPMTVDFRRFEHIAINDTFQKPYIAYCGSGGFYTNGLDILILSFAKISNEYPGLKLYIAAFWGQDGTKMLELIKETGMTGKVIYLGALHRDLIPSFLYGAEVLALPRPDSKQAQGGFPTKLGEYLASGKPVCVTKVGEIPSYLVDKESAFFSEPNDIESFAASLRTALNNKSRSTLVGINGRKVAERCFNMDVQARNISAFLKEIG